MDSELMWAIVRLFAVMQFIVLVISTAAALTSWILKKKEAPDGQ